MARPAKIVRPTKLHLAIPEDLRARMDLHLYSQVEQRIPVGAYQDFLCGLAREFFEQKKLDISTLLDKPQGTFTVAGTSASIEALKEVVMPTTML